MEKLLSLVTTLERKRRAGHLTAAEEAKLTRATSELERVIAELDRGEPAGLASSASLNRSA